jgi:hypothetical protein
VTDSTRKLVKGFSLASFLLAGFLAIQLIYMSQMNAWAGAPSSPKSTTTAGDIEMGRAVFNGKGVCYYCHGMHGNMEQRPQLAADEPAFWVGIPLREDSVALARGFRAAKGTIA